MDRVEALEMRVKKLEISMETVTLSLAHIEQMTGEIKGVVTFGKGVTGFFQKHGVAIITFLIGAGYMNPNFGTLVKSIFGG